MSHSQAAHPSVPSCRYEDDGISTEYLQGANAITHAVYAADPVQQGCTDVYISTFGPGYNGMATSRNYTLAILSSCGQAPPSSVTLNGAALSQADSDGQPGTWFFTGSDTRITLLPCAVSSTQALVVCCAQ